MNNKPISSRESTTSDIGKKQTGITSSSISLESDKERVDIETLMANMSLFSNDSETSNSSGIRERFSERDYLNRNIMKRGIPSRNRFLPPCKNFEFGKCTLGNNCKFPHNTSFNISFMREQLIRNDREIPRIHKFSQIQNQMIPCNVKPSINHSNSLDLVICLDLTNSMGEWVESVHEHICSIVDRIKNDPENRNIIVRVGFVGFRDHSDGDDRLVTVDFTSDVETVKVIIQCLETFGGDDGPEDVTGGLKACCEMNWQANARAIVFVCDAPCHFPKYHDDQDSSYNLAAARELYGSETYIETVVSAIATKGIDFWILEVNPSATKKMSKILQNVYDSSPMPRDGIRRKMTVKDMAGKADAVNLGDVLLAAAQASVSDSRLRMSSNRLGSFPHRVVSPVQVSTINYYGPSAQIGSTLPPSRTITKDSDMKYCRTDIDWERLMRTPSERARRYSYIIRSDQPMNWSNMDLTRFLTLVTQETKIKLSEAYFNNGAMRTAHQMYDETMGQKLVAKVYINDMELDDKKRTIDGDAKTQTIAKHLALEFSKRCNAAYTVDFLITSFYVLLDRDENDRFKFISAEPYLQGEFKKYNNNNGWAGAFGEMSDVAQAFSHFTWLHTGGKAMIVDLQGVRNICTDPQIHAENFYGKGNFGHDGIGDFFRTHKCNPICHQMELQILNEEENDDHAAMSSPLLPSVEHKTDQVELSCSLCGDVYHLSRNEYMGSSVHHCMKCNEKLKADRDKRLCVCGRRFDFSPYLCKMIGTELPTHCPSCKKSSRNSLISITEGFFDFISKSFT